MMNATHMFTHRRLLGIVALLMLVLAVPSTALAQIDATVTKDYRYTNVCFEQDNDGDGVFNEDPVNFDAAGNPIDDDNDGLFNEDDIDCLEGTSLGDLLPGDPAAGEFEVEAVVHKNGKVSSYNPGQYYAVSAVEVASDLESLTIWEYYGECTDPETGEPLSKLNPPQGGGSVVIVRVDPDGVAWQIADAKSPNVWVTDENDNGIPDDAHADLGSVAAGDTILMYVKFSPGLKGKSLDDATSLTCTNENVATTVEAGTTIELGSATAELSVVPKGD
jgi:hypothetical protein